MRTVSFERTLFGSELVGRSKTVFVFVSFPSVQSMVVELACCSVLRINKTHTSALFNAHAAQRRAQRGKEGGRVCVVWSS